VKDRRAEQIIIFIALTLLSIQIWMRFWAGSGG
jgi:hypothetical protein